MALHPGQQKRHFPEELPVVEDPIRRALEEDEDWYRDLVEHSRDLLCAHDLDGRFLSINPVPARLLGYSVEEVLQKPMRDFIDPQFRAQFDSYLREIASSGQADGLLALLTRSGEQRIWEYHNTLRTEGVETPIVRGIAHDVTERVRAEKALRAANEQLLKTAQARERVLHELTLFRTLLDQLNDAILVVDPETRRFLDVNERACVELGYSREELLSMRVFDIDLDYDESSRARMEQLLRESGFATMERVHRRKDGTTFPVEVNMRRVRLDRDYCVAVSRDITARKQAQKALRESELRFRAVYERSPIGIALVESHTGRLLQVNPKYCEIAGRSEEELAGVDVRSITHADDVERTSESLGQLVDEELPNYEMDKRYLRPDGSVRWVRVQVVPMWGRGRTDRWHMGLVQDITEGKQAEEALRTSEREQHKIAEQLEVERARLIEAQAVAKVGSWEVELPSLDIIWSEQTHRIFETDPSSFHPRRPGFVELVHPEDCAKLDAAFAASLEKGTPATVEYRTVMADGRVKVLEEHWKVFRDGEGRPARLIGTCQDITERKQSEEAIARLVQEVCEAKKKLTEEKLYFEQEIDTELGFGEIVGKSKALQAVMEQVGKVAASNATVLLLGETGTGKELVARAIHRLSLRASNSFIKMNCAAIPSGLLESELFGNEKGAFTGAVSRKIGRLELADKGTLFLDEIGEISLALQPKLLRVLQDREFERLGGTQTLTVDFRLIAATNRNLADQVREKEFRSDLYYRLNVFPILVPPLRERREDIRLLVEHFVKQFSRRMNRSITSVPRRTMDALMGWEWPGNVRELENFIERSVILTRGSVLVSPLGELTLMPTTEEETVDESLGAAEREHILRALRESHGKIGGVGGAAVRLGLKRTTLQSKLKQLGINPRSTLSGH